MFVADFIAGKAIWYIDLSDNNNVTWQNINGNNRFFVCINNIILLQCGASFKNFNSDLFSRNGLLVQNTFADFMPFQRQPVNRTVGCIELF